MAQSPISALRSFKTLISFRDEVPAEGGSVHAVPKALAPEYPMLGLVGQAFPYRGSGPRYGKYTSLVLVAPCNMACPYCDVGGYEKDRNHFLPGWEMTQTTNIEAFVEAEVAAGRIIYISGGEPLYYPELATHVGKIVRAAGGYTVMATNASLGSRLIPLADTIDEFSISLKGSSWMAEQVSGVKGKIAFEAPRDNVLKLARTAARIEMVVVLFDGLTYTDIRDVYHPLIGRADIVLKEYRPKITRATADHDYRTTLVDAAAIGDLRPISEDLAREFHTKLIEDYPEHKDTFTLVLGGGRSQVVVKHNGEESFHGD